MVCLPQETYQSFLPPISARADGPRLRAGSNFARVRAIPEEEPNETRFFDIGLATAYDANQRRGDGGEQTRSDNLFL